MSSEAKRILVVDPDRKSRRILEVSLRKAGYESVGAESAHEALELIDNDPFHVLISETELPDQSGFELVRRIRARADMEGAPVIFLTNSREMSDKLKGFELGVEDYIAKPAFVREVAARVSLLLKRREKELLAEAEAYTVTGDIEDISLIDIFQTIEDAKKTGAVRVEHRGRLGTVYFKDGEPVDSKVGLLMGEAAVHRMMGWSEGRFNIKYLSSISRPRRIECTFSDLVVDGLQRTGDFEALTSDFAPMERVFRVNFVKLAEAVNDMPETVREILQLFDGRRTVRNVIDDSPLGDLESLQVIRRHFDDGLLERFRAPGVDSTKIAADEFDDEFALLEMGDVPSHVEDWLRGETASERAERERQERRRREEEKQLRAELEKLQVLRAEADGYLREVEAQHKVAEARTRELEQRESEIYHRLTGEQLPPATTGEDIFPDLVTSKTAPTSRRKPQHTVNYPALKFPGEPDTVSAGPDSQTAETEVVPSSSKDNEFDRRPPTDPGFRTDMLGETARTELDQLRKRVDSEKNQLLEAQKQADQVRRKARKDVLLAEEERRRAEELERIQSDHDRLERERQTLIDQRSRLQSQLADERSQLEHEQSSLDAVLQERKQARETEAQRLRLEVEEAKKQRSAEETLLEKEREALRRLKAESKSKPTPSVERHTAHTPAVTPPAIPGSPEASDERFKAVEDARRRLIEAVQSTDERDTSEGKGDEPRKSTGKITPVSDDVRRSSADTPMSLAAVSKAKRAKATRAEATPVKATPTAKPAPQKKKPVAPAFVDYRHLAEEQTAKDESKAKSESSERVKAPGKGDSTDEEFSAFFKRGEDDLYDALYTDEHHRKSNRTLLLWGVPALIAAVAIIALVLSTGRGNGDERDSQVPAEVVVELTEEELLAMSDDAQIRGADLGQQLVGTSTVAAIRQSARSLSEGVHWSAQTTNTDMSQLFPGQIEIAETPQEPLLVEPEEETADRREERPDRRDEPRADRRDGEESQRRPDVNVDRALRRARQHIRSEEWQDAAEEARQILLVDPTNRRAHQYLGEALLNMNDAREAVDHLERATRTSRPNESALLSLGTAQIEAGDESAANATFNRFLELYPDADEADGLRAFLGQ